MAAKKTENKPGILKKILLGMGCGCVYPLIIGIVLIGVSAFYFANIFSDITKPVKLPEISTPSQSDYWHLQEKQLVASRRTDSFVSLTQAELNAFLSTISLNPYRGFCLHRIRFHANENGKIQLFLIGSGFFIRNLVFVLDLSINSESKPEIDSIAINNWKPEKSSFLYRQIRNYLNRWFSEKRLQVITLIDNPDFKIEISSQEIRVPSILISRKVHKSSDQ
jgi:hypothetical protein